MLERRTYHLILQAALDLPKQFSREDLIVAAWKLAPNTFGLPGYEAQYPDSHRVYCSFCGPNGLVRRGYLKQQDRFFSLTKYGRALVEPEIIKKPAAVVTKEPSSNGKAPAFKVAEVQYGPSPEELDLFRNGQKIKAVHGFARRARMDVPSAYRAFEEAE